MTPERVVLLDESGASIGVADKSEVHSGSTPLHLAFSCYVFRPDAALLLTRRALTKRTWPGVWTNSCCGHPEPGEALASAVRRRLGTELGIVDVRRCDLTLPTFRYRAVMADGVVENEMCPVFTAVVEADPRPNGEEVDAVEWVPWLDFASAVSSGARSVSPWCGLQVAELVHLGPDPLTWAAASADLLPAAARGLPA